MLKYNSVPKVIVTESRYMNPITFLREVKVELERVVWPGRKQVLELTVLVIAISLIIGAYVGALDLVFTSVMNTILK